MPKAIKMQMHFRDGKLVSLACGRERLRGAKGSADNRQRITASPTDGKRDTETYVSLRRDSDAFVMPPYSKGDVLAPERTRWRDAPGVHHSYNELPPETAATRCVHMKHQWDACTRCGRTQQAADRAKMEAVRAYK